MQGRRHPSLSRTPRLPASAPIPTLVQAARGFLDSWLVKKNYDAAFAYMSPKAYACYDLERDPAKPASTSPEDAGRKLRAGLEAAGATVGTARSLKAILSAPEPVHPAVRVMNHSLSRVFSLTSMPNALADAAECAARAAGSTVPDPLPLEYGAGFSHEHSIQDAQRRCTRAAHALAQGGRRLAHHLLRRREAVNRPSRRIEPQGLTITVLLFLYTYPVAGV